MNATVCPTLQIRLTLQRAPALALGTSAQPLSRKDAALLAVLALDGSCARDTLALMLWPGADLAHALASLRQRRFRLAQVAGTTLIEGEATLRLVPGVSHPAGDPVVWLQRDASALDGELLEGLSLKDCPDFENWLALARERWCVQRAQALARVASQLETAGELEPAIAIAQRLVAEDPLSEHAHRRLMRLHYLHGDLGAALEVYRSLAQRLDAELGELPDDETASLAASLRMGQGLAPARTASAVPPTLRRPPRRIGSDTHWAALEQAFAERMPVVIEGAPGAGKSRLLGDFVAQCDPSAVLLLTALAGDAERPYALLMRLLSRLWFDHDAQRPGGADALPDWARRELATLLPELGAAPPRADALRLQRAVALALTQAKLTLIALDDVQQADAATLELLPVLTGPGLPCWWLASRTGELPATVTTWLQASCAPRQLHLEPLSTADIGQLLTDLALPGIEGALWADKLMRHTGGLPLFVLETLRSQHEQPLQDLATQSPSAGVAQVVRARAARLPEAARQLAHAAALLRAPLPLEAGAALLGGQPGEWVVSFEWLEASQWLDASGRMHDLVGAALRQAMPAAQRRWLHGNIAGWLQQQGAAPLECAEHYEAAGRDADAAPLFEAAALVARHAARPAEDATLYERAVAAWERAGQPAKVFLALRESVNLRRIASGTAASAQVAERLMAMASTCFERMAALNELAWQRFHEENYPDVLPLAREALAIAESIGDPAEVLKVASTLSIALAYLSEQAQARALLERLQPMATAAPQEQRSDYLKALAHTAWTDGRMADCANASRELLAHAVQDEDWGAASIRGGNLAQVLYRMGCMDEAWAVKQQVLAWRNSLGAVAGVDALDSSLLSICMSFGRIGSAIAACTHTLAAAERSNQLITLALCMARLAECHLLRGDAAAAHRALLPAIPVPQSATQIQSLHHRLLARIAAALGDDPEPELLRARAALNDAAAPAELLKMDAEVAWFSSAGDDPARLQALEQAARQIEQGALATRLAWWRVDALRRAGQVQGAAQRTRELLAQPLWPDELLPCHWLWIAQAALDAAADPQAEAVAERARAAHAATLADLGSLSGPPAQWAPPKLPRA